MQDNNASPAASKAGLARIRPIKSKPADASEGSRASKSSLPNGWYYNEKQQQDFWDDMENQVTPQQRESFDELNKHKEVVDEMTDSSTKIKSILTRFDDIDQETLLEMMQIHEESEDAADCSPSMMLDEAKTQVVAFVTEIKELSDTQALMLDSLKTWFKGLNNTNSFLNDEAQENDKNKIDVTQVYQLIERLVQENQERTEKVQNMHNDISDFWIKQIGNIKRLMTYKEEEIRKLKSDLESANNARIRRQKKAQQEKEKSQEEQQLREQVQSQLRTIEEQKGSIEKLRQQLQSSQFTLAALQTSPLKSSTEKFNIQIEHDNEIKNTKLEAEAKVSILNQQITTLQKEVQNAKDQANDERDKYIMIASRLQKSDTQIKELEQSVQKYIKLLDLEKEKGSSASLRKPDLDSYNKEEEIQELMLRITNYKETIQEMEDKHKLELMHQSETLRVKYAKDRQKLIESMESNDNSSLFQSIVDEYEKKLTTLRTEFEDMNQKLVRQMGGKTSLITRQFEKRIKQVNAQHEVDIINLRNNLKYELQKATIENEEKMNQYLIEQSQKHAEEVATYQNNIQALEEKLASKDRELENYKSIAEEIGMEVENKPEAIEEEPKKLKNKENSNELILREKHAQRIKILKEELNEQHQWELEQQRTSFKQEMEQLTVEHQQEVRDLMMKVQESITKVVTEGETTLNLSEALEQVTNVFVSLNDQVDSIPEAEISTVPLEEVEKRTKSLTEKIIQLSNENEDLKKSQNIDSITNELFDKINMLQSRINYLESLDSGNAEAANNVMQEIEGKFINEIQLKDAIIEQLKNKIDSSSVFIGKRQTFLVYEQKPIDMVTTYTPGLAIEDVSQEIDAQDDTPQDAVRIAPAIIVQPRIRKQNKCMATSPIPELEPKAKELIVEVPVEKVVHVEVPKIIERVIEPKKEEPDLFSSLPKSLFKKEVKAELYQSGSIAIIYNTSPNLRFERGSSITLDLSDKETKVLNQEERKIEVEEIPPPPKLQSILTITESEDKPKPKTKIEPPEYVYKENPKRLSLIQSKSQAFELVKTEPPKPIVFLSQNTFTKSSIPKNQTSKSQAKLKIKPVIEIDAKETEEKPLPPMLQEVKEDEKEKIEEVIETLQEEEESEPQIQYIEIEKPKAPLFMSKPFATHIPMRIVQAVARATRIVRYQGSMVMEDVEIVDMVPNPPPPIIIHADEDMKNRVQELQSQLMNKTDNQVKSKILRELSHKVIEKNEHVIEMKDMIIGHLRETIAENEKQKKREREEELERLRRNHMRFSQMNLLESSKPKQNTPRNEDEPIKEEKVISREIIEEVKPDEQDNGVNKTRAPPIPERFDEFDDLDDSNIIDPYEYVLQLVASNLRFVITFKENEEKISQAIKSDCNAYESYLQAINEQDKTHYSILERMKEDRECFDSNVGQLNNYMKSLHDLLKMIRKLKKCGISLMETAHNQTNIAKSQKLDHQKEILKQISSEKFDITYQGAPTSVNQLMILNKMEAALDVVQQLDLTLNDEDQIKYRLLVKTVKEYQQQINIAPTEGIKQQSLDKLLVKLQDFITGLKPRTKEQSFEELMRNSLNEVKGANQKLKHVIKEKNKVESLYVAEKEKNEALIQKIEMLNSRLNEEKEVSQSSITLYNSQINMLRDLLGQLDKHGNDKPEKTNEIVIAIRDQVLSLQALLDSMIAERDVFKVKALDLEDELFKIREEKTELLRNVDDLANEIQRLQNKNRKTVEMQLFHETDMQKIKMERALDIEAAMKGQEQIQDTMDKMDELTQKLSDREKKIARLKKEKLKLQNELDDMTIKANFHNRRVIPKEHIATQTYFKSIHRKHREEKNETEEKNEEKTEQQESNQITVEQKDEYNEDEDVEVEIDDDHFEEVIIPPKLVSTQPASAQLSRDTSNISLTSAYGTSSSLFSSQVQWIDSERDEEDPDNYNDSLITSSRQDHVDIKEYGEKAVENVHQPLNWAKKKSPLSPLITPKRVKRIKPKPTPHLTTIHNTDDLVIGDVTPGKRQLTGVSSNQRKARPTTGVNKSPQNRKDFLLEPLGGRQCFVPQTGPPSPTHTPKRLIPPSPDACLPITPHSETIRITSVQYEYQFQSPKTPIVQPLLKTEVIPTPQKDSSHNINIDEIHKITQRLREKIIKLQSQVEKKDSLISSLRVKITELTRQNQSQMFSLIRAEDQAKRAILRYNNQHERHEIIMRELGFKEDEIIQLKQELIKMRSISAPATSTLNKMKNAQQEQIRIKREQQKQKNVLEVTMKAMTHVTDESVQQHLTEMMKNTQKSIARLEAKRQMWNEVERKQMMGALSALSLIDEKPTFVFYDNRSASPFVKSRMMMRSKIQPQVDFSTSFDIAEPTFESRKKVTIPSYARSLQNMDKMNPRPTTAERRDIVHGTVESELAERLLQTEAQLKEQSAIEGIVITSK